ISARIAENVGAATDVPPTAVKFPPVPVRKPTVQLDWIAPLEPSSEQTRYPSGSGDSAIERSGTSRLPSFGTPGPVCQGASAFVKKMLAPPPVAERVPFAAVSFQAFSGIYSRAEETVSVVAPAAAQ